MEQITVAGTEDELQGLATAPEIFVEGYRGAMVRGGVLKLNLFSTVLREGPKRLEQRAVATLAIPTTDFLDVVNALVALRDEIVAREPAGDKANPGP